MPAPTVSAILAESQNADVREAMLLGSWLEGGWGPTYGVGDSGTSFGPYQIHLPAHPGVTRQQAEDPVWASDYMYGNYVRGVTSVQPVTLWITDPEAAAEQAAYRAEAPREIYHVSRGWSTVDRGWAATVAALRSAGQPLGEGGAGSLHGGGGPQATAPGVTNAPGPGGTSTPPADDGGQGCPTECVVPCAPCHKAPGILKGVICPPCYACEKVFGKCGSSSTPNPLDPFGVIDTVPKALSFLFSLRFLEILGGGILVIVGLILLGKQVAGGTPVPVA